MKIICAVTMMGPNWWLKRVLEQVYHDGIRNVNTIFILRRLALPVVLTLLLALTVPYVIAAGIVPLFGKWMFMKTIKRKIKKLSPFLKS